MQFKKPYTVLIRKGEFEYVGICLELNVSARGKNLAEVERNLKNAINDYIDYARDTNLTIEPIPPYELIEFLRDTLPKAEGKMFQALRLQRVHTYV